MNLDVVLQLGKIVASIEQKPVSLNDVLWRVELLSRMKAIFEWALVIDCNCQSVEDDSCYKAFLASFDDLLLPLSMLLYCS